MVAALALVAAISQPATRLTIEPWNGRDLVTTTTSAAKYRLTVSGKPKTTIRLKASKVASGWLAAFCTAVSCAPQRVVVTLPDSGQAVLQFELIREQDSAPSHSGAVITANDGAFVKAPQATR